MKEREKANIQNKVVTVDFFFSSILFFVAILASS